jgi:hypothetical protein
MHGHVRTCMDLFIYSPIHRRSAVLGPRAQTILLCITASLSLSQIASAGSARDYLNEPIDSWLTLYNAVLLKTGRTYRLGAARTSSSSRSSLRGRWTFGAGGFSIVLPYALVESSSSSLQARANGLSDIGFLWQMNIFGGPRADARAVPLVYPRDVLQFSSLRRNAARCV